MKRFLPFLLTVAISLQANLFFTPQMISTHLSDYSEEEILLISKDLEVVRSVCFKDTEPQPKDAPRFYLATAGAPGARKTTILERFISTHPEYKKGIYLDPDPRTLKFMVHTYYNCSLTPFCIASDNDYGSTIKNAYEKWADGSNYIAFTLLEEAFRNNQSVIHGTTSTRPYIPQFFSNLKQNGYQIILLLSYCPDEVRKEAISYRNETIRFYQSSPEDALAKGKKFPQRMGAYFASADVIYMYWSDALFPNERLAAIWKTGNLEVLDEQAFKSFIGKYEEDRALLRQEGILIPAFEEYL